MFMTKVARKCLTNNLKLFNVMPHQHYALTLTTLHSTNNHALFGMLSLRQVFQNFAQNLLIIDAKSVETIL